MKVDRWLIGALIVGALLRLPGVAWGFNWPDGFGPHHPDEYTHVQNAESIVTPFGPQLGVPYPKATGAQAAVPFLLWYAAHGHFGGPRLHQPVTVLAGRLISVAYGVATILVVFLIGRDAFGDRRAARIAAWLLAFGGLHVTQSHFFVTDVPVVFWTVLAAWLLWRGQVNWAAFAVGAAFATKLFVFAVPALAYAVLRQPPRWRRGAEATVFAAAGFAIACLGYDSPASLYRAAHLAVNNPFEFSRVRSAEMYLVEAPAIFSVPLLAAAAAGTVMLVRRVLRAAPRRRLDALAIFGSIPLVATFFILFKLDPFARHWLLLIPWAALAGGYALARGRRPALVLVPVFAWMLAFAVDGERYFIFEPRNDALRWIRANVPPDTSMNWVGRRTPEGYKSVRWLVEGLPDVLVWEMYEANNSLSGVSWRNSSPASVRQVFDGHSQERVDAIQAMFRGTSEYKAVARFGPHYVMPEFRLENALLGDRARNFITEVVVFERRAGP